MNLADLILLALLGYISFKDIVERRIQNLAVISLFFLGLWMSERRTSNIFANSWESASAAAFVALVVFLLFHVAGLMGAGDVKLAAGLGMCLGLEPLLPVWVVSLVLSFLYIGAGRWLPIFRNNTASKQSASGRFQRFVPYGALLCISVGVVLLTRK